MAEIITLVVGILALMVTIISERNKLGSFIEELKKRRTLNAERKKALAFVDKISSHAGDSSESKSQVSSSAIYVPIFLISIISSAALSFLRYQPNFYNTILLSSGTYFSIAMIVAVTFVITYQKAKWQAIVALFAVVLMVSFLWGILVISVEFLGLRMMWSGIVSGLLAVIFLFSSERNQERRLIRRSKK